MSERGIRGWDVLWPNCPNALDFREPHYGGTMQHRTNDDAHAWRGRCSLISVTTIWPRKHHDGGFTT